MVARRLRLRSDFEVRQARSRGKAYADGPVVIRVARNDLVPPGNRYAFIAGKRAGGSVQRNRVKRLCREAIRHAHPRLRPGHDLVVIIRGTAEELPDQATVTPIIEGLLRRARLLAPLAGGVPLPAVSTDRPTDAAPEP
jgi:ribonuclease P protein component